MSATMVLLLSFNSIFREVREAPSAGWEGGAGSSGSLQATWSFPEALLGWSPASVSANVQTTVTLRELTFLEQPLCARPFPRSLQAAPELRGGCDYLRLGEEETEAQRGWVNLVRLLRECGAELGLEPTSFQFHRLSGFCGPCSVHSLLPSQHRDLWAQRSLLWLCLLPGPLSITVGTVSQKSNERPLTLFCPTVPPTSFPPQRAFGPRSPFPVSHTSSYPPLGPAFLMVT